MQFSRPKYWSGQSFPSPGDLPNPGIKPPSLMSPVLAGGFFTISTTWGAHMMIDTDVPQKPKILTAWLFTKKCADL